MFSDDLNSSQLDSRDQSNIEATALAENGGLPPSAPSDGPLAGAPPSNTAPANCIESDFGILRILHSGVDSLYLSYQGSLSLEAHTKLRTLKEAAQSISALDQCEAIYEVLSHRFEVQDKGAARFPYILVDNAYRISLAGLGAVRLPLAYIQVKSEWLTAQGLSSVCKELDTIIARIGNFADNEGEAQVSRVDIFVDFVTPLSLAAFPGVWVTRAKNETAYTIHGKLTGYTFGQGGDLSARLYNKTKQIEKLDKEYLKKLWWLAGWQPDQTVWRLEFQFMRRVLIEHGIKTVADLLPKLGPLWLYATTHWLKLAVSNPSDETRTRWPLHPLWVQLVSTPWEGADKNASIPARPERLPSEQKLFINGLSGITSYMALEGITNIQEAFARYHDAAKHYHDGRSHMTMKDFSNYLREKAAAKARKFNRPYPSIDERIKTRLKNAVADAYRKASDGE